MTMTIEDEITDLVGRWCKYVGQDHCKDRDCHFYVEKHWSYGEPPTYKAYHNGYRTNRWESPKCATAGAAQSLLLAFLKHEIAEAINYTQSAIEEYPNEELPWNSLEQLQGELAALTGNYKKED